MFLRIVICYKKLTFLPGLKTREYEKFKMKILHISKFYPPEPGGIENFAADLASAQARGGNQVYVLAHHGRDWFYRPGSIARAGGVVVERVRTFGQLSYVPVSPEFFLRLSRVIKIFKPDVIHVHVPNVSAFFLLLIKVHAPVILHWHADVVASRIDRRMAFFYSFYRPLETLLIRAADRIICTSGSYLRYSRPLRKWKDKCIILPLGLDPARIGNPDPGLHTETLDKNKNTGSKFRVLCVGRFAYYKGFEYVVKAALKVPMAEFVLVGDGPGWVRIKEMVCEMGLEGRVYFPGRVDDKCLRGLFASCDIFCLPSVERTEAFGLVLLEAMAFGKPLVTTKIAGSGVNEVNVDGITGLQVPPADPVALAEAINALGSDQKLCRQMGAMARRRFEQEYQIDSVCAKLKYW